MATLVLTVPDELVWYAKRKGVFTEEWTESVYRDALIKLAKEEPCPPGFPPEQAVSATAETEDAFGIWKDRDISLAQIREKAWSR